MLVAVILLLLVITGIIILKESYDYEGIGVLMVLIFGVWFILHILVFSFKSYEYEITLEKRNAFQETLNIARENNNNLESAAILSEIANFNASLAKEKYKNNTLWFDQFIDDRIDTMEPIK